MLFNESEAIENLVNNGTVDNTYNWGWSIGYSTAKDSSPRFNKDHLYVPSDREFHFPVNDKNFPKDIRAHFSRLHNQSNNCLIEEILPKSFNHPSDQIPVIDKIEPKSQTSSTVMEGPKALMNFLSLPSDRSFSHYSPEPKSDPLPFIKCPLTQTYSAVVQSSLLMGYEPSNTS